MPAFSEASKRELDTLDPRLQDILNFCIKYHDFKIIQGKRTVAEAADTVKAGVSHTNHSKHVYPLNAPSLAVDVAPWPVDWKDTGRFYYLAGYILAVAKEKFGVTLRYGGDWDSDGEIRDQTFNDLGHFEIVE